MKRILPTAAWPLLAALLLFTIVSPAFLVAHAATITSVNYGFNPANTPDNSSTGPRRENRSLITLQNNSLTGFCMRYQSVLAVDVAAGGNTESEGVTNSYNFSFDVTELQGKPWFITITSHRNGAYTIVNDGGAYADVQIQTPISATITPGGTLPGLQFAGGSVTNEGNSGNDVDTKLGDSGTACISGMGTGLPQTYTLNFEWASNVISHGSISGGDEAALRLGLPTLGLNRISAGDYPGPGNRTAETDGHFVCVMLSPAPKAVNVSAEACSPQPPNEPCTITACGSVVGCLEQNYSVFVVFADANGATYPTGTSVNNGSPNWCVSVTNPGPCKGPYTYFVYVLDNPGLLKPENMALLSSIPEGYPVARGPVLAAANCGVVPPLPSLGEWGRIVAGLLLLGVGAMVVRRRRYAN